MHASYGPLPGRPLAEDALLRRNVRETVSLAQHPAELGLAPRVPPKPQIERWFRSSARLRVHVNASCCPGGGQVPHGIAGTWRAMLSAFYSNPPETPPGPIVEGMDHGALRARGGIPSAPSAAARTALSWARHCKIVRETTRSNRSAYRMSSEGSARIQASHEE